MSDALAQLLELRVRFRRNPEARALVDRALVLVARAAADDADRAALEDEFVQLAAELARRFGTPSRLTLH
jgi:RNase P protein component